MSGRGSGTVRVWQDMYEPLDRATQTLAVVASALETLGSPHLHRSALEAHAYASMLRAELRVIIAAEERAAAAQGAP